MMMPRRWEVGSSAALAGLLKLSKGEPCEQARALLERWRRWESIRRGGVQSLAMVELSVQGHARRAIVYSTVSNGRVPVAELRYNKALAFCREYLTELLEG